MRVKYEDLKREFYRILKAHGFSEIDAQDAAKIFADNSLFGVYSHGLNRFPTVVEYLDSGVINPKVHAKCTLQMGCMERWDGQRGFGPLNAKKAMDRACELAKEYGIGLVALGNNNHWMRGGTYGWLAAEKGLIGICWSNTWPNMPAWGAKDPRIGNNPLVISVPRANGEHILLDMALSQYSYGKVEQFRLQGLSLPFPGGYDTNGELTTNPEEIEKSERFLPIGFWKGSGLSIALDLVATVLSDGLAVSDIRSEGSEVGLTQILIAIDPRKLVDANRVAERVEQIVDDLKKSTPSENDKSVTYPGEGSILSMKENLQNGIPVIEEKWNLICNM